MRDGGAYGCAVPRAYANLNPGLDYIRQTPVLGDPNATAFLKAVLAPVMFNLYSNDLPLTRGRNFIYPDDMSRHSRPILQRTGIQSRQIWRGSHTSVDSGDLNQAPPKQSAVCSTCIIPAPPVNCQFIWMASAFGMSATQPIDCRLLELSSRVTLDRTLSYRTETTC